MDGTSETKRVALRRRRRLLSFRNLLVLLLLAAVVLGVGFDRDPADNTKPLSFDGVPSYEVLPRSIIRVGTFNMRGGKGTDGVRDLGRTSSLLQNLDFVALQEVYGGFPGIRNNQATDVGRYLEMASLFVPAERRWWHDSYGNAILTQVAPTGFHAVPLVTTQHRKYRTALLINVPHQGKVIHFLTVHLDTVRDRTEQLTNILDLFRSLDEPAVLMGDLNTKIDEPEIQKLLAERSVTGYVVDGMNGTTPVRGVDWIIARGLRVVNYDVVETVASDHPLLSAELELITQKPLEQHVRAATRPNRKDEERR